jgi:erythritol transport system permease protein
MATVADSSQAATDATAATPARPPLGLAVVDILMKGSAFIALLILIGVFAAQSDVYLSSSNLTTMTRHVAINAIMGLGMLLVILKGGIDLSVGSTVGLSAVTAGQLIKGVELEVFDTILYPPVWVIVLCSLAIGTLVGTLNGLLVTRFNVAPFIATLGMLYVARGAALLLTDGQTISILRGDPELGNTGFRELSGARPLGLPMAIWIMAAFALVVTIVLRTTPFGRWLYASGGNERAAELAGVPVRMVKRRVYMISGFCAATAGLIMASELDAAPPQLGATFELNAIAAVVIGGASLAGGRGTVRGVLIGAFVIGFLSDGLVLVGVSTFWQQVIKGTVIVVAVILDQLQQRVTRAKSQALAARHASA